MKKLLILFTFIVFGLSSNAWAVGTKVAVVDIQKVLQDSTAAKGIRESIKKRRDQYQAEITAEEEKLREAEKKLSSQSSVLSKEAFEQKREEFKDNLTKVQRDVQEKRANLDNALSTSLGQVQNVVFKIIGELAKEKGFDIAIPTSQILYAGEDLNITTEVLDRLNKELPKADEVKNTKTDKNK